MSTRNPLNSDDHNAPTFSLHDGNWNEDTGNATVVDDDIRRDDTQRERAIELADAATDSPNQNAPDAHAPRNALLWLALSLLAFYAVFALGAWSARHSSKPPLVGPIETRSATSDAVIIIHIAGAVRRPGVYRLNGNARVFEALQKAGGALKTADTDALNLADWAQDGARIEVPFKTQNVGSKKSATPIKSEDITSPETTEFAEENATPKETATPDSTASKTAISSTRSSSVAAREAEKTAQVKREAKSKSKAKKTQSTTIAGLPRALTPDGKLSDNASPQFLEKHPLDLNQISREQLEALPGVGPSLAQKILDYRAKNGGFKSVDELDGVSGIGEKKLAALKPLLYVVGNRVLDSQESASQKSETSN